MIQSRFQFLPAILLWVAMLALAVNGGVKYWDNPAFRAFDVADYAPGAVWFYDGIRNQGADQPHSTTTTTWGNLGSAGASNDMFVRVLNQAGSGWYNASSALASLGRINGRDSGSWTKNGFVLTGDSEFRCTGPINSGTDYTLQMVMDAAISKQTASKPYFMSVEKNAFAFSVDKSSSRLYWKTQNQTTSNHPYRADDAFSYMTSILNDTDKTATFFSGTMPPTEGNGFRQFDSVRGLQDTGYCIGGYTGSDGCMLGTIYCYRYYKRVLTQEELVWNRVLDEARFFGRRAPIPATNIVITANYPHVGGIQPNGNYFVDSGELTFTAPASTNVRGRAYSCTGYTLETWDGTAWGTPVVHANELSYTFTDTSLKVRLTWQWTAGDGLVHYNIDDYVWDGLVWFYDGIRNVGKDLPHDPATINWNNLGSSGSINNLFLQRVNASGNNWETANNLDIVNAHDPGRWADVGFTFAGNSRFRSLSAVSFGTSYTLQTLLNANANFVMSIRFQDCSLQLAKNSNFKWNVQTNNSPPYIANSSYYNDYATAILDDTDMTAKFFNGVTPPTEGNGLKQFESLSPVSDTGYSIGAAYGTDSGLTGTLKFFRYYDRVLTDAEIAQNRLVDDYRYFGPPVTNVVVETTYPLLHGNEEEGAYEVSGSYTFTAPASLTAKGITYTNDGYTVEAWDGSTWTARTVHVGNSYAYATSAGKVRLTWQWKAVRGLRSAADYGFDDYSQAGLIWNYDGILNVGIGKAHSTNTTTWVNLGSAGMACDLARTKMSDGDLGEWTDGGYEFRGHTRFKSGAKAGPFKSHSLQILMEADVSNQNQNNVYVASVMYDYLAIGLNKTTAVPLYWNTQGGNGVGATRLYASDSEVCAYATALLDYDAMTAAFFNGMEVPTSGDGFKQFTSMRSRNTNGYGLGCSSTASESFTGTIKSFRCYDRVLTQEEIVRNRNVDSARYFGELATTNVFVVAGCDEQSETGAYKVEGSWLFSATRTLNEYGATVLVERYATEELVDGEWSNKRIHAGNTYTYTEGTDPATVRLTWLGPADGSVLSIR
ncbi:MAG: hypothetical protein IKR48_07195 [Kiritimatiellae bacterium]|nr:hypothetical protein [Kiritimatiellia bacterium]